MPFAKAGSRDVLAYVIQHQRKRRRAVVADLRTQVISALFGASEQGILIDPSDLTTLFQDAAGTTPVTADGQPVGLALDLSQGTTSLTNNLGPEVISNGDFSAGSVGWSSSAGGSFAGGAFSTSAGLNTALSQSGVLTAGKTYVVSFDVTAYSSGAVFVYDTGYSAIGVYQKVFVATATSFAMQFAGSPEISVDNISVRELPGNHLTQSTAAARPLYRMDGTLSDIRHDLVDDALVATLPDLGTDATVKYVTTSGITTLTNQTISGSYTVPQADWFGMIVYESAMSTSQAAAADAWLNAKAGL